MRIHRAVYLCHPVSEVFDLTLECFRKLGPPECSEDPQHSCCCPRISCSTLAHPLCTSNLNVPTSGPVPSICLTCTQDDMLPQSICRTIREVIAIQPDLITFVITYYHIEIGIKTYLRIC